MKLRSIYLENFRSYKKLNVKIGDFKFIILTGKNGSGKTNLLEAISFLSPGKGLRNSKLDEVVIPSFDCRWNFASSIMNS